MPFRFWRRVKVGPGITLNLSKSGGSVSVGPRGARLTVGPRGARGTAGIPGTGIFYTKEGGWPGGRSRRRSSRSRKIAAVPPEQRLHLGFFRRLVTPDEEEALVDGCRLIVNRDEAEALKTLRRATHLPDGAYLAGYLALKAGDSGEAAKHLKAAVDGAARLGRHLDRYGIAAPIELEITDEVSAHVEPNLRGALLMRVEALQQEQRWREAVEALERLRRLEPDDIVVKLSLAELLLAASRPGSSVCRKVVRLAQGVTNESAVHAALLLYKGRALRRLGMLDTAVAAMTVALRRTKDRPPELLHAIRFERAQLYEEQGRAARALEEYHRLFAASADVDDLWRRIEACNRQLRERRK